MSPPPVDTFMEVIMTVEKIGNVMEIVSADTRKKMNVVRQPNPQPANTHGDVVSLGNSQGANNVGKIYWPPLFPIGDTQSIFKIDK
jgi:hypothetical protein